MQPWKQAARDDGRRSLWFSGIVSGRGNSTLLPTQMDFLAIDLDLPWRFDAELDAARRDGEHRDAHIAGDDDGLVETPGENQHESSLCFHSGSSARSVHAPIMGARTSSSYTWRSWNRSAP